MIEEHRRSPLGQHSEALERLLNYFRRQPQVDKYAISVIEPFKAYRIVALSGHRGVPPRVVEDKIYATTEEAYPRRIRPPSAGSARSPEGSGECHRHCGALQRHSIRIRGI